MILLLPQIQKVTQNVITGAIIIDMILVLLNKRALATPIENDIKIALVDIDLNKVNSICAKKKFWKIISILFVEITA